MLHLSCSAWVNSAFYPLWDGKMFTISLFTFENLNKMLSFFPTMTPIDKRPAPPIRATCSTMRAL